MASIRLLYLILLIRKNWPRWCHWNVWSPRKVTCWVRRAVYLHKCIQMTDYGASIRVNATMLKCLKLAIHENVLQSDHENAWNDCSLSKLHQISMALTAINAIRKSTKTMVWLRQHGHFWRVNWMEILATRIAHTFIWIIRFLLCVKIGISKGSFNFKSFCVRVHILCVQDYNL